ncbi:MAG: transcriptional regulator [Candidatus Saccharimonadales bacterium]
MIEQLFGSKTRVKLLHLFYNNPNRSFYVREITRKIDEQINSVRRELANLLTIGIIKSDSSGNRLYYEVNQKHPHYDALHAMFTKVNAQKDSTLASNDATAGFKALGSVEYAALSGVFTRDQLSPVDVLIVGDVNRNKLEKLIKELEGEEGQELRYTVLSREQYDYRRNLNDRFLTSALDAKQTVLIDKLNVTEEPAKTKTTKKSKKTT